MATNRKPAFKRTQYKLNYAQILYSLEVARRLLIDGFEESAKDMLNEAIDGLKERMYGPRESVK